MKIEYVHASKYGNGAKVAEAFRNEMAGAGVEVAVHHVRDVSAKDMPPADLYVFSSPGRMGRPIGSIRRLLKRLQLSEGTRYALLTTEMAPQPDKKTGRMPTEEEICRFQHVRPIMHELLQAKGLGSRSPRRRSTSWACGDRSRTAGNRRSPHTRRCCVARWRSRPERHRRRCPNTCGISSLSDGRRGHAGERDP